LVMLDKRKTIIILILMLSIYSLYPLSLVTSHAPNTGTHSSLMDLAIQAYKTYLVYHYGLSHSDWDPNSYLGRPPLIIYPIVPFIVTSSINKIVHDYTLSCIIAESIFRSLPIITAITLCVLDALTTEAFLITVIYFLMYGLFILFVNMKFVRLTTPMGVFTALSGIIIAYSNISKRKKTLLLFPTIYFSELCNFIYPLPAIILLPVIVSPILLAAVVSIAPVAIFTIKTSKLMFYNVPAASSIVQTIYLTTSTLVIISILILIISTTISLYLLVESRKKADKIKYTLIILFNTAFLIVNISCFNYSICDFILRHIGILNQLDTFRLMLPSILLMTISIAELVRHFQISLNRLVPILTVSMVATFITGVLIVCGKTTMDVSLYANYYNKKFGPDRSSCVYMPDFNNIFPSSGFSYKISKQITGAFYQGTYESEIRILSSLYTAYRAEFKVDFSTLTIRGQLYPWLSKKFIYKLCKLLPVDHYEVSQPIFSRYLQISDLYKINYSTKNPIIKCNDVYYIKSNVLYLGRPTDYSYLWLDIVNTTRDRIPNIVMVDLRDSFYRQNTSIDKAFQLIKPKLIIIDPTILKYKKVVRIIEKYKSHNKNIEIVAVKSVPEFDHLSYKEYLKLCNKVGAKVINVFPVLKIDKKIAEKMSIPIREVRSVGKIRMLRYPDELIVRSNVSGFVVLPMSFAPYWSVNGSQVNKMIYGPYMIIKVHKGNNYVKYVGWENYQSKAYEKSILFFLLSYILTLSVAGVSRILH